MDTLHKKDKKTQQAQGKKRPAKTILTSKRKRAIEKAILFWKANEVDMSQFKFDRQEANAR